MNKNILKELQKAFLIQVFLICCQQLWLVVYLSIYHLLRKSFTPQGLELIQFMKNMLDIGVGAFSVMIPLLSGYIAYSIAGKPALAPGMILGYVANNPVGAEGVKTGFLGAMLLGINLAVILLNG